ncbi:MAG: nucleoside-diphosphate kinase, partial [Lentisphaeria bacterium]|nr:nucleoside-diphosphate kinase [Lentisphaeria bacterium]
MAIELSYVLITPYSLMKSRTGGIIARLLSRSDLELVGAQVLIPSEEFGRKYSASLCTQLEDNDPFAAKLFSDYIRENLLPQGEENPVRILILLFRGEDACRKLSEIVGSHLPNAKHRLSSDIIGETIRDTYADLVFNRDGSLNYFEPAVFTPSDPEAALQKLEIIADEAEKSPNIVEVNQKDENPEKTLVVIKPDNWREPSTKPGSIIDMFSRTGLKIVSCKIHQMSVQDALELYAPVKNSLRKTLAPAIAEKARLELEGAFGIKIGKEHEENFVDSVGIPYADEQFNRIIEFMSGFRPDLLKESEYHLPGKVKSMVLVYEGRNAVSKIRDVLGPIDPT